MATTKATPAASTSGGKSKLQRLSQAYRPQGPKQIALGNTWTKGTSINLTGQVDLSTPIVAMRFILKGRIAVTTAAYTSVTPEQLLNLIKELKITGTNTRQNGNVTLFDMDLATWFGIKSLINRRGAQYFVSKAAGVISLAPAPTTPFFGTPTYVGFDGTVATFDFIISFDVPFYPQNSGDGFRPGWALRASEWANTIQIVVNFATLIDNSTNEVGVSAATTVTTLTAFQSGAGLPTLDIYSIPAIMGLDLAPQVLPGVLSLTSQPVTSAVQSSGSNVAIIQQLQKQNTGRIFFKTGVSTFGTSFSSLSDQILTAVGVLVGANRAVRNNVDIFAHKVEWCNEYLTDPIQGYMGFDFLQSDNPFSAYPGGDVSAGATFQLVANVVGAANQQLIAVQEQQLFQPSGSFYQS